jgi:DNA-binding CsgD family transcriptional regulator
MGPPTAEELYERRMEVYRLRRSGSSVTAIGQELGVSQATVSKDMAWLRANGYQLGGTDLQIYESARDRARTSSTSDPSRIAELRHKIVTMRLEGHVPRDIARTLGIALQTVQNHLAAVFNALTTPKAEEARQLELDRYDRLLTRLEPGVDAGDVKSILAAAKIGLQRAQIQGLNKPIQIEVTSVTIDAIDQEIMRLSEKLADTTSRPVDIDGEVVNTDAR